MSEFFTRPPDIPEEELNSPRVIPPETAFARTIASCLMLFWLYWWWTDHTTGAFIILAAVAVFATGETMPHLYRRFLPLWWPLSYVVRPITAVILAIVRLVIPEAYRRPQQVQKPLSFKQINEALDEEAARMKGDGAEAQEDEKDGKDKG